MSSSVLAMKRTRVIFKTTVRWSVTSGVRAAGLLRPINRWGVSRMWGDSGASDMIPSVGCCLGFVDGVGLALG